MPTNDISNIATVEQNSSDIPNITIEQMPNSKAIISKVWL